MNDIKDFVQSLIIMPFIKFIYRIGNNKKTYYGKHFARYISDDHEGLDNEVKSSLIYGLNKFREQNGLPKLKSKIHVGILSLSIHECIPTFSTLKEIKVFDFYHEDYGETKTYINGKLLLAS